MPKRTPEYMPNAHDKLREPPPKNLKEVPGYVWRVVSKFFYRLFYIFGLVWETKPSIMFVLMFLAVVLGLLPVASSLISADVLNTLAEDFQMANEGVGDQAQMLTDVFRFLIWQFAIIFASSLLNHFQSYETRIAGELVTNHVNIKIMKKTKVVDLASFDSPDFYEKFENASREAGSRPIQILSSSFNCISAIIGMVSYVTVLANVSPIAPWVIVVISLPSAIINFIYRRKTAAFMMRRSKDRRQLGYYKGLMTNKDLVKEIRLFGLSDTFIERYNKTFKNYFRDMKRLIITEHIWNICITVANSLVNCVLFVFIAKGVISGNTPVGNYSLYTGAITSVSSRIGSLVSSTATIYEGTLFIENLIVFMKEKVGIVPSVKKPLVPQRHIAHKIELKNVSFKYPGSEKYVLKNLNATFEAGETVVLVGLNGAGKTTLIKLITRLYDVTEGQILLDGHDIREYNVEELYKIYGIIFQDFGKYAVSVKENIAFSDINAPMDDERIRKAAIEGNADSFIRDLPSGYDTALMRIFEKDGTEPSIGQWQKLSVARAFYSDSDILILDEPTASLDAIAEQEIYSQFDNLRKDKTTVFVSHRLSSATTADKILVLEHGGIIEQGNHAELMQAKGRYYELFSTQAARYINESKTISEEKPRRRRDFDPEPPIDFSDTETE